MGAAATDASRPGVCCVRTTLHEFLRRLHERGADPRAEVLIGRGETLGAGASGGVLGQALRRLCGVPDGTPPADGREQLRSRLAMHLPAADAERVVMFLGELCGVPWPEDAADWLRVARDNPKVMSDQVKQALQAWLRAECAAHPVLLIIEDLHWADAPSIELVEAAVRQLADQPFMVLLVGRPEAAAQFPHIGDSWVQTHKLSGLSKRSAERLVMQALGPRVESAEVQRIIEQAGGNALFLEESVPHSAEKRNLRRCE